MSTNSMTILEAALALSERGPVKRPDWHIVQKILTEEGQEYGHWEDENGGGCYVEGLEAVALRILAAKVKANYDSIDRIKQRISHRIMLYAELKHPGRMNQFSVEDIVQEEMARELNKG